MAAARSTFDRRPAAPPPTDLPDELDRTAQQVRLYPLGDVHQLKAAETREPHGRLYWTICGRLLPAAKDAVLTTYGVTCWVCRDLLLPRRL